MLVNGQLDWGRVFRQVWRILVFDLVFAFAVGIAYEFKWMNLPPVPGTPVSLMGAALGIILGFRTNSAYDRWWEARTLWGALVNSSRTLGRQILSFTGDRKWAERIVFCQIAFVHTLRCHLRGDDAVREVGAWLPPEALPGLKEQRNKPAFLLHLMGQWIAAGADEGKITELRLQRLDQTLSDLTNILGGCERIKNTPLPRQYDYFPEIFIYIYCLMFPFTIVQDVRMLTPLFSGAITFVFLILNRIGKNLEDPFDSISYGTPMLSLSRTIEINLLQQIGATELPPVVSAEGGVLQ